jgi:prepilin signal peptidase PulO-like enzyme (type II secretory pathway)
MILMLLAILFLYDLYWLELPTEVVYQLGIVSMVFVALHAVDAGNWLGVVSGAIGSLLLGGLFWLLYQISAGKWIGGGDVRLGFAMGLFLGWQQAFLGLSLAAYIGTFIVLIAVAIRRYKRRMKLPFGPLLIAGWYISFLWGQSVIDWYSRLIGLA